MPDHDTIAMHDAIQRLHARSAELRAAAARALAEAEATVASLRQPALGPNRVSELTAEIAGLRKAMETRAVIEQAKGIVMAAMGCDADEAFKILVEQSQHENRKLHTVAADLVRSKIRSSPAD
jgi:hypothetical protein